MVVNRRRYAEYGAPSTSSSTGSRAASPCSPNPAGWLHHVDGPQPVDVVPRLPEPFGVDLDTSGLSPA